MSTHFGYCNVIFGIRYFCAHILEIMNKHMHTYAKYLLKNTPNNVQNCNPVKLNKVSFNICKKCPSFDTLVKHHYDKHSIPLFDPGMVSVKIHSPQLFDFYLNKVFKFCFQG